MRVLENKPLKLQLISITQGKDGAGKDSIVEQMVHDEIDYFTMFKRFIAGSPKDGYKAGDDEAMRKMKTRILLDNKLTDGLKLGKPKAGFAKIKIDEDVWDDLLSAYKEWTWGLKSIEVINLNDYLMKDVKREEG